MTSGSSIPGEPSPSMPCEEEDASDDPFASSLRRGGHESASSGILVPTICVTPDTRIIDSGYHNFWVAVEVTTDLRRFEDEPDRDVDDTRLRSHRSIRYVGAGE